ARPGEDVLVRVDSGSVSVDAGDESRDVAAGETIAIAAGAAPRAAPQALTDEMLGWTTDSLVVSERPLRDVLPQIARWYALDLWVADSALLDRPVALRAGLGSSGEVIRALEESANVRIRNVDRRLFITDAPGTAPARPARGRSA
ncbi:MAG TPA: DUF4974 domain-containing protein, partial [Gemmatimonadaceae bacterium]